MSVTGGTWYVSCRPPGATWPVLALAGAVLLAGCTTGDPATPTPTAGTTAGPASATGSPATGTSPSTDGGDRTRTTAGTPNATPAKGDQPAALESRLYGLVTATNRTAYASVRGLDLRNGSVRVVVELRDGAELPASFDLDVESRYENLVQVFVPVGELVPLAEHGNVSFVRTPREAEPGAPSLDPTPPWLSQNSPDASSRSRSYCC